MQRNERFQLDIQPMGTPESIDMSTKTLNGTQVMMKGISKGHGMEIDEVTLDQIASLGNSAPKGIKTRFGHPTECTPSLGTFLGRRTNFRREGDYVRSDFNMSDAARPEYADHVLAMAKSEPDMIGNSVVVTGAAEYRVDHDGKRLKDETGKELLPVLRVKHLHAVDVVDEPAAGDGMFSEPVDGVELSPRTVAELRSAMEKPGFIERAFGIFEWLKSHEEIEPQTEEQEVSPMSDTAVKTLSELRGQFAAQFEEYRKEIEASLTAKAEGAVTAERERVSKILSRCKPHHFAKTKEHPEGFATHAISEGLDYGAALEKILELNDRANKLELLESESAGINVDSVEANVGQLSKQDEARKALEAAREKRLAMSGKNN